MNRFDEIFDLFNEAMWSVVKALSGIAVGLLLGQVIYSIFN